METPQAGVIATYRNLVLKRARVETQGRFPGLGCHVGASYRVKRENTMRFVRVTQVSLTHEGDQGEAFIDPFSVIAIGRKSKQNNLTYCFVYLDSGMSIAIDYDGQVINKLLGIVQ